MNFLVMLLVILLSMLMMVLGKFPPGQFPPLLNSPRSNCLPVSCPTPNLTLDWGGGGFTWGIFQTQLMILIYSKGNQLSDLWQQLQLAFELESDL